tara:strand:- start:171 stop:482 length:312 start_codon:yes stop_codon:yes gene_type:complete
MSNQSLLIMDYGTDFWKQHGVTEQYHLRSWTPTDSWSNPIDCVALDANTTLENLGSYHGIASANATYGIKTIANAVYDYDDKYLHTSGRIYWYDYMNNHMELL